MRACACGRANRVRARVRDLDFDLDRYRDPVDSAVHRDVYRSRTVGAGCDLGVARGRAHCSSSPAAERRT